MLPINSPLILLLLLLFAHFLADFPWQGDFLSKAKNASAPIPGVPWYTAMSAHCGIQAGFVGVLTGSVVLAALEFMAHFAIDYAKCRNLISFNQDQLAHIACKLLWVGLVLASVTP